MFRRRITLDDLQDMIVQQTDAEKAATRVLLQVFRERRCRICIIADGLGVQAFDRDQGRPFQLNAFDPPAVPYEQIDPHLLLEAVGKLFGGYCVAQGRRFGRNDFRITTFEAGTVEGLTSASFPEFADPPSISLTCLYEPTQRQRYEHWGCGPWSWRARRVFRRLLSARWRL
jgi:hypothetical protein